MSLGIGFGWNVDELTDHGVPAGRRRTMLREYLEAMRALWSEEQAEYAGEFVNFGPSWAWPKPVQKGAIPTLVGAAGTDKNFAWIVRSADGWITTPGEQNIESRVARFQQLWRDAGRGGNPEVVVLDFKPDADKLARGEGLGVTEVVYGMPDKSEAEVLAYLERLSGKLMMPV